MVLKDMGMDEITEREYREIGEEGPIWTKFPIGFSKELD